ncbi:hypothetical protein L2E82_20203 [Cichorium intybus]|uniref:Uncharacterized protein n=1 Tax=Cichorium intybus TaxID=13427 RepID=A0ACB9DSB5_CICIN|nr:hypothetical protein L2E82_20203 [Cichorium intybus]
MERSEIKAEVEGGAGGKKKIFVSGATGKIGKRIVEQLLPKGFAVKAGVRDAEKAKSIFPNLNQDLQIVSGESRCRATEKTGKRIVEQLLAKGFAVKAGVRHAEKAKSIFPNLNQDLQIVKADVTEGSEKLAEAIGDDSDAVVNQIGTMTEAIEVVKMAKDAEWGVVISQRSGETDDCFIADLAVDLATCQIKAGAPSRGSKVKEKQNHIQIISVRSTGQT